jgi:hypothetical protein
VAASGDAAALIFLADDALRRVASGDLFAPVLTAEQTLPDGWGEASARLA